MEGPCLLLLGSWIIMYLSKPETGKLLLANTLLLFPKFTTRSRVLVHCSSSTSVTIFCCSHILWHCWAQVCRIANSCYLSPLNATLFLPSSLHLHPEMRGFSARRDANVEFQPFWKYPDSFYDSKYCLSWYVFQVLLKRMCVLLCLGFSALTCQWVLLGCLSSSILTDFLSTHYINYLKLRLWVYFHFQLYQLGIFIFWSSIIRSIPIENCYVSHPVVN